MSSFWLEDSHWYYINFYYFLIKLVWVWMCRHMHMHTVMHVLQIYQIQWHLTDTFLFQNKCHFKIMPKRKASTERSAADSDCKCIIHCICVKTKKSIVQFCDLTNVILAIWCPKWLWFFLISDITNASKSFLLICKITKFNNVFFILTQLQWVIHLQSLSAADLSILAFLLGMILKSHLFWKKKVSVRCHWTW